MSVKMFLFCFGAICYLMGLFTLPYLKFLDRIPSKHDKKTMNKAV